MAENHLEGRVIGIALDGTGYGTDGRIWGGEVLLADYSGFERAAHLAYVPMPGGEAAIREPWRMAVSYLVRHFGCDFVRDLPLVKDIPPKNLNVLFRHDGAGHQLAVDLELWPALRRGGGAGWNSPHGELRGAGGNRVGNGDWDLAR